ncbi:S-layer homology domain-containing protein [Natronincola ferrireducens]|uniref:S-layer homology domain-containing protein n=1 Tax=Natronincola ferrireducens TaxID=393762 RepID=A0A1G8X1F5_9FIRM|nr:S-layer homology domain-containing protein [Natronincola ferrireducens]SDJ84291.1 S-layer homology domain-containing protein [Natronincola ferrireducens]
MKKKTTQILLTLLLILSFTLQSYGLEIPGYEGGIQNEMLYREVIFLTGEPIVLEGTVTVRDRGDRITYTYRNLRNLEKNATLTRNITLDRETISNGRDQKREIFALNRYRETININGVRYEATEAHHAWSKSNVFHEKPGVTYFAGNWDGKKVYTINRNQGTVEVETQGTVVGYDHHWGATQTQTIQHYIEYNRSSNGEEEAISWEGTAEVNVVNNRTKDYHYEANIPSHISFRGGYLLTEKEENIVKYSYNLPRLSEDGEVLRGRTTDTKSFTLNTTPLNERLNIPTMRDAVGHWAEKDILFLGSLEALNPNNTTFGPSLPMSRSEFAKALAVVMGIEKVAEQPTRNSRTSRNQVEVPLTFKDVAKTHPNYGYIEALYQKGIMGGRGDNQFQPNQPITRAEATLTIIKALGFEGLAPLQQYYTGYQDDPSIPSWARDAAYLMRELGIDEGIGSSFFQANRSLTKGEVAHMLTNLVNYLQQDLRYDYRERILNYY